MTENADSTLEVGDMVEGQPWSSHKGKTGVVVYTPAGLWIMLRWSGGKRDSQVQRSNLKLVKKRVCQEAGSLTFQDLLTELLDHQCRQNFFALSTIAEDTGQKILLEIVRSDGSPAYFKVDGNSMEFYNWNSSGGSDV